MVPFQPNGGQPKGKIRYREVKVGILSRLTSRFNRSRALVSELKQLQYHHLKEAGLPIGSGLVESACKWLIQQRFKGVGMRWGEQSFTHLLLLRLAWVNGRFEACFCSSPNF